MKRMLRPAIERVRIQTTAGSAFDFIATVLSRPRLATKVIGALSVLLLTLPRAFADTSCPLTESQAQKSIAAFSKIATFISGEPRCANCHGAVNPYIDGTGLDFQDPFAPGSFVEHGGPTQPRGQKQAPDGTILMDFGCKDCHDHMAPKRDGSPSIWTLAPSFLSFTNKPAFTLCRQIKRNSKTAENFLGHLRDDNGGSNFAKTAFNGDRGLNPKEIKAYNVTILGPAISHAEELKLAQDWISAMGGKFQGDESCGCEPVHPLWSGEISYVNTITQDHGHNELQDWSGREVRQISVYLSNGRGIADMQFATESKVTGRRPALRGGVKTTIPESERSSKGYVGGGVPATVEVQIDEQNQTYKVTASVVGTNSAKGTVHRMDCRWPDENKKECKEEDRPLSMSTIPGPLEGKLEDVNHIRGSKTDPPQKLNGNGESITTWTWDLSRTGSN
jgi:hypothetical protein